MIVILILGVSSFQYADAQGTQTSGGVNVDGSWYVGEGLEKGNYFEYRLCELDLNDCAPITLKMWIKGDLQKGTETLWDAQVVILDGNKIIKGHMELGKVAPEPVSQSEGLFHYARAFKSSVSWLSAFATSSTTDLIHGPKEFKDTAWGKIGAIGGAQLTPRRAETINIAGGNVDTVVVGWYSGKQNEIWIVDNFPFPVKALTYAWVTTGIPPVMYQFNLVKYEKNVQTDPFVNVVPTIDEKAVLGCPSDFFDYTSNTKATNTFSMQIEYAYSPGQPMSGCDIDWKIGFKNKYNDNEFVDEVHYDIWSVDENGKKLRSYAEEKGRANLFNGFGQAHVLLPVKEPPGTVAHYAIFIYGAGPQFEEPNGELAGYLIVDIPIASDALDTPTSLNIPSWIKNNARWWADGQIDDNTFVQGIQYLITNGIMKIR